MLSQQDIFLEELYRNYFTQLKRYAQAVLREEHRAQEVVQDTFLEAFLHIDRLITHQNIGGWLKLTLKYKIKESNRERNRHRQLFLDLETAMMGNLLPLGDGITEKEETEVSILAKVKKVLTGEEYRLLTLFLFENASHLEIAKELHISLHTSKKRLERIREKLYKVFPERRK